MTLTRILPSLRRSIPDPLNPDAWPELSHATTTDVFVSGVSLLRVADLCGTPSTHTAAAVIPCTGGRPSSTERASVLVTRVTGVTSSADGATHITLDACLHGLHLECSETRLLGRASTAKVTRVRLSGKGEMGCVDGGLWLPSDLAVGDLLAIPCRGVLTMFEVNPAEDAFAVPELWLSRLG